MINNYIGDGSLNNVILYCSLSNELMGLYPIKLKGFGLEGLMLLIVGYLHDKILTFVLLSLATGCCGISVSGTICKQIKQNYFKICILLHNGCYLIY